MDVAEVINRAIKYLIEGLVVAGAALFIPPEDPAGRRDRHVGARRGGCLRCT